MNADTLALAYASSPATAHPAGRPPRDSPDRATTDSDLALADDRIRDQASLTGRAQRHRSDHPGRHLLFACDEHLTASDERRACAELREVRCTDL